MVRKKDSVTQNGAIFFLTKFWKLSSLSYEAINCEGGSQLDVVRRPERRETTVLTSVQDYQRVIVPGTIKYGFGMNRHLPR